ncbi:MAG: hypothetical protein R3279_00480 [Putridiphycobacter sp.]|nr:hypothetical protein [Putridiphycobacter sp.]
MAVIFNLFALYQIVISVIALGLIHFILYFFGYDMIGGTREAYVSLLIIAFVSAYLDVRGFKGRIFFIPTWLVAMAAAIFVYSLTYTGIKMTFEEPYYIEESLVIHRLFLTLAIISIVCFYIFLNRKYLRIKWQRQQNLLKQLETEVKLNTIDTKQFWQKAAEVFYKPSNTFIYFNSGWQKIFPNTINEDSFIKYYQSFVNLIKEKGIPFKNHEKWTSEFKEELDKATAFELYNHPIYALARLGTLIDRMNNETHT